MGKRNRDNGLDVAVEVVETVEATKKEAEKTAQSASNNPKSFFKRKQALIHEAIEARKNGGQHTEHHDIIRHL